MATHPKAGHHRALTRAAMRGGIAGAGLILVALLALGWRGGDAVAFAAAALLLVCVGTCTWAWVSGERARRRVDEAVHALARERAEPPGRSR